MTILTCRSKLGAFDRDRRPENASTPPACGAETALMKERDAAAGYFAIRLMRSPASFSADSILTPRFWPVVEMNMPS
jgi:hypothetical protein